MPRTFNFLLHLNTVHLCEIVLGFTLPHTLPLEVSVRRGERFYLRRFCFMWFRFILCRFDSGHSRPSDVKLHRYFLISGFSTCESSWAITLWVTRIGPRKRPSTPWVATLSVRDAAFILISGQLQGDCSFKKCACILREFVLSEEICSRETLVLPLVWFYLKHWWCETGTREINGLPSIRNFSPILLWQLQSGQSCYSPSPPAASICFVWFKGHTRRKVEFFYCCPCTHPS